LDPDPYRRRRDVVAIVAAAVMGFESITKGWLIFLAVPALLVAIPMLFGVRSRAERLRVMGRLSPSASRLATAQLIGLLVAYLCVPGYGDTSDAMLFGLLWVPVANPMVRAMWYCGVAGAIVAVISSIAFFKHWKRAQAA
jgi:hypothetical protein